LNRDESGDELQFVETALRQAIPRLDLGHLQLVGRGFGSVAVADDRHIFRIARTDKVAESHEHEMRLLPRLASLLPVSVPLPRWRVESSSSFPHGALGYEKIPGQALSRQDLDAHKGQIRDQVARFLVCLHGIASTDLTDVGLRGPEAIWSEIRELHRRVLPMLSNLLSPSEYAIAERWWYGFLNDPKIQSFQSVLRHGDFWHGNLLVDPAAGKLTGVVDWEVAAIADPAQDFATLRHLSSTFADDVLTAYRSRVRNVEAGFGYRVDRYWEMREFSGIVGAVVMSDEAELMESVDKLRNGPVFP
jgi:aminoglycoside phosphotransferase (APT) family kinase protein